MIHIRPMTAADLPLGLTLSRQANWNQTEGDWQRAFELQPDGCFVAEWDGKLVGTTTTCVFGPVAWIAMVLVEASMRGRGIGKALMRAALAFCDERGIATVRLDATPMGQPLYERLGFVEQFRLARHGGIASPQPAIAGVETASPDQWETLAALDAAVTRTDRRRLLQWLFASKPEAVRSVRDGEKIVGYMAARRRAVATHLGPCIADAKAGPILLADACGCHAGQPVVVDVPVSNDAATRCVVELGLTVQRPLTRMVRGVAVKEDIERLWAAFGPEKG